jgi:hypothetical protein
VTCLIGGNQTRVQTRAAEGVSGTL